jgi:acetyl esterase
MRNRACHSPWAGSDRIWSLGPLDERAGPSADKENQMSLDPDNQQILDMMKAAGHPPVAAMQPDEARKMYRASRGALQPELPDVAEVRELSAPGPAGDIPLRLYRGMGTQPGPLPVMVFYHGGGYVIGDLDTHDYVCRKLANVAQCCVIAVDYRLAPEHKFPAAVEDSAAALRWIVKEAQSLAIDTSRILRVTAKCRRYAFRCSFIPVRT